VAHGDGTGKAPGGPLRDPIAPNEALERKLAELADAFDAVPESVVSDARAAFLTRHTPPANEHDDAQRNGEQ
jgi:hypothetical protein